MFRFFPSLGRDPRAGVLGCQNASSLSLLSPGGKRGVGGQCAEGGPNVGLHFLPSVRSSMQEVVVVVLKEQGEQETGKLRRRLNAPGRCLSQSVFDGLSSGLLCDPGRGVTPCTEWSMSGQELYHHRRKGKISFLTGRAGIMQPSTMTLQQALLNNHPSSKIRSAYFSRSVRDF